MKYKSIFEAAKAKLRGDAMESLSVIELMLLSPESSDPNQIVRDICTHARALAANEGALITLEQYFTKKAPAPPPRVPAGPPNTDPPIKVTPEISPTYKKSIESEKIKKSAKRSTPATAKVKKGPAKNEK